MGVIVRTSLRTRSSKDIKKVLDDCNLHGILTEYQGAGETLLKKVTVTDKDIKWADCTEEEVNNFYGEVNAEEVKKIFE